MILTISFWQSSVNSAVAIQLAKTRCNLRTVLDLRTLQIKIEPEQSGGRVSMSGSTLLVYVKRLPCRNARVQVVGSMGESEIHVWENEQVI